MSTGLSTALIVVALLTAAWTVLLAVRDRPVGTTLLAALAVLELLAVAQLVVGIVSVARDDGPGGVTFFAYLVGSLLVLPVVTLWSLAERSRSGTLVLTVGCLALPVMTARLLQLWNAGG